MAGGEGIMGDRKRPAGRRWQSLHPSCPDVWTMRLAALAASARGGSSVGRGGLAGPRPLTPDPRPGPIPLLCLQNLLPPLLARPLQQFLSPALFHLFTCSALLNVYLPCWIEHAEGRESSLMPSVRPSEKTSFPWSRNLTTVLVKGRIV